MAPRASQRGPCPPSCNSSARHGLPRGTPHRRKGTPGLLANTALQLGPHRVWLSDQGRGRVILRDHRQDTPGRLDLHHGSWELLLLHDGHTLIYARDDGLMMLDLVGGGGARRIAQTADGDLPLAWNPSTRELAWTSPRLCGLEQGGDTLGLQLYVATLDSPRP